ncbi:MAG: hypothetical protein PHO42_01845 [Candidatus Omnitrophica bacterium]|nr:hypothetical protein [Candidatus Omnitrophota bacterium]
MTNLNLRNNYFLQQKYSKIVRCKKFQLLKKGLKNKLYLDVGCGTKLHTNFVTLDYHWVPNLDLCWDITKGLPLADKSFLGIYTEHCLEHFIYSTTIKIFRDFLRLLKPNGNLRIILPDAELYIDLYQQGKSGIDVKFPYKMSARDETSDGKTPMMEVARAIGGDGFHRSAYDYRTLQIMLKQAGFVDIRRECFGRGRDPVLLIDSKERACESIYVEASAPI